MDMPKKDFIFGSVAALLIIIFSYPTLASMIASPEMTILIPLLLGALTMMGLFAVKFMSRWLSGLWQFGKFAVIGGLNTFLDFAILNLLMVLTHITGGLGYSVFKGASFVVAVINSYFWNKHWTFESKKKNKTEFWEFIVVSLIGWGINVGTASFVVNGIEPFGSLSASAWANVGAFAATILAWLWNFLGYKFVVFKKRA